MAYLGKYETRAADFKVYTSSTATATHTLSWTPTSKQSLRITINGVVQQDDAFSLTGNTVTLDAAILVTDVLEIVGVNELGGQVLVPADGSIQTGKLGDNSVTLAKMAGGTDGNLITYDASGDPAYVATGTATHVLTSNGAGAAPTFQEVAAGGKILQVVQTVKTDETTTTSTSFVDISGMTVSITPSAATSKVLVFLNLNVNSGDLYMVNMRLLRDSTPIFIGDQAATNRARSTFVHRLKDTQTSGNYSGQFLDSPATTSATTYKVQWAEESGETARLNFPTAGSDIFKYGTTSSTITAMEVGA